MTYWLGLKKTKGFLFQGSICLIFSFFLQRCGSSDVTQSDAGDDLRSDSSPLEENLSGSEEGINGG